jgi:hypothetical protein
LWGPQTYRSVVHASTVPPHDTDQSRTSPHRPRDPAGRPDRRLTVSPSTPAAAASSAGSLAPTSRPREYYPAALHAFQDKEDGLTRSDARVILTLAPTPARAAKLTLAQLRAALKRSGRTRSFDSETERLRGIFRSEYARQLPAVEDAFGHQLLALVKQLDAACQAANDLAAAVDEAFRQHADSEILLSFPGLGPLLGARVLAEIGDDHNRFADARALKSYASSAPITRASGKKRYVGRRFVKNNRLMNAGFLWSFSALQASPRSQRPLPAPARARRLAQRRPAPPAQPLPRTTPPLSSVPAAVRRTTRLRVTHPSAWITREPPVSSTAVRQMRAVGLNRRPAPGIAGRATDRRPRPGTAPLR